MNPVKSEERKAFSSFIPVHHRPICETASAVEMNRQTSNGLPLPSLYDNNKPCLIPLKGLRSDLFQALHSLHHLCNRTLHHTLLMLRKPIFM